MERFCLKIAYDGSGFSGWQIQPYQRTVQFVLQQALSEIAKTKITVIGSGRTDAEVHALAQYAHFDFPIRMTSDQIILALNSILPPDLRVIEIFKTPSDFHARFKAYQRSYRYIITRNRTPFNRLYKAYLPKFKISVPVLEDFLRVFIGEHDFSSFAKHNPEIQSNICNLINFKIRETDEDVSIELSANRFLHNMVRRLIGTSLNLINKKYKQNHLEIMLNKCNPAQSEIYTAPPQGLYLFKVLYPEKYNIK